jgi:hypothetical protein
MKSMIGKKFSFLNYYKEIPVSYDATLLSVENEMAEFDLHEYQAKVINLDRKTLIYAHKDNPVKEDFYAEAFYINVPKKRVILCKFEYSRIRSNLRRFVRVILDKTVEADLIVENDIIAGHIKDISLGGASATVMSRDLLSSGVELNAFLKLPDLSTGSIIEVGTSATVVKLIGDMAPYLCVLEFHPEKHSQQQLSYYINQRQVEIIKELKELNI